MTEIAAGWKQPKWVIFAGCALVTIPADQLTKLWITANLAPAEKIEVIGGFFYLTHVRNAGAVFGLIADSPAAWRTVTFALLAMVAFSVIAYFFRTLAPGDRLSALALGLILGGAAGNLIDRFVRGEVVDFLHFKLIGGFAWPDFNLADTFIVAGVMALMIELLATEGQSRAGLSESEHHPDRH